MAAYLRAAGGLSDAVRQACKEQNIDFDYRPIACDGIEQCRMALLKLAAGKLPENFIEGMACISGLHRRRGLPDARRQG